MNDDTNEGRETEIMHRLLKPKQRKLQLEKMGSVF